MNIALFKDISIAIAIGSKVIDIWNKAEITQKIGHLGDTGIAMTGVWVRWQWLSKIEIFMLIGGLFFYIFFLIYEQFHK